MQYLQADENYLKVYQNPLVAGSFLRGNANDSGKIVLNETAARLLEFRDAQDAIGKSVSMQGDSVTRYMIAGVTKDFHFGSMQNKISPAIFVSVEYTSTYRFMSFKLPPGNITSSVNDLEKAWKISLPGAPFEYRFMNETLKAMYRNEMQLQKASYTASALAIIIVLSGILGLISLSIQKRTKEIGVRKILGSSVRSIIFLFMKDFFKIILLAAVIACPVAWFIMNKWLQEYAYRVNITALPFFIAISLLTLITALLIGLQTSGAALANPVKSLRDE